MITATDQHPPARSRRWTRRGGVAAALAVALLAVPAAAFAEVEDDPNLDQTLSSDLAIVHGDRVLETGHVDMGPKFAEDGTWRFLIHDDVARADANATSVWRYPAETVFHILDAAVQTVPEDDAYSFVGAEAGSEVYVVPQTQNPDVVWVGWNTQDPEVMATIDRGITLSLTGVQGPGTVTVYLQSGSFGEPDVLWDSRVEGAQSIWVDVNTHTHANWVFTEPGVYLLQLTAEATLLDGSTVTDTQEIRFAVGTGTSTDDAFAATWDGTEPTGSATATESPDDTAATAGGDGGSDAAGTDLLVPILIGVIVLIAVGLVTGFTIAIVRGNRARKRILAARRTDQPGPLDEAGPLDGEDTP